MKKLVSLLLAALMLLAMVPAVAESIPTGTWHLVEAVYDGQTISTAALGMSVTITLNEDGTAQMVSSYGEESEEESGSWTAEGTKLTLAQADGSVELTLEGDRLVLAREDGSMIFSQNPDDAVSSPAAQPVAAESEDAFLGTWNLSSGSVMGVNLPAEMLGLTAALTIEPGRGTIDYNGEAFSSPSTFVDGQLKLTDDDGTVTTIVLNDNGQLSITVNASGQEITMYFAKAE